MGANRVQKKERRENKRSGGNEVYTAKHVRTRDALIAKRQEAAHLANLAEETTSKPQTKTGAKHLSKKKNKEK